MNVNNFSNKTGASNPTTGAASHMNIEEESTMNATESKQGIFKNLSGINPTRFIIGLALGVTLLTATAVSLTGQATADSLHKTTTIQTAQDYSDDEWMFGWPFIELNPGLATVAELSITADDKFVFGSPYVELNPGSANVAELTITADDEFVFGSPYVELNPGVATVAQLTIIADDEFVFGSPFVQVNPGVANVAGFTVTADDEWVFGSPFVESDRVI